LSTECIAAFREAADAPVLKPCHYPDGAVTTFGYDKVGNRQSVTRMNAAVIVFNTTGYTYDALNRLMEQVVSLQERNSAS